jgi:hypothetical protein
MRPAKSRDLITLRCRGVELFRGVRRGPKCVREVHRPLGVARQRKSFREESDGSYTFICKSCGRYGRLVTEARQLLKEAGFKPVSSWRAFEDDWRFYLEGNHPKARALREAGKEGTKSRRRQGGQPAGSGGRGQVQAEAVLLRAWRGKARVASEGVRPPKQRIRQCLICGKLLQVWTSPTAIQPRMHGACRYRTPEVADLRSEADLTRNFGWAIRHYLGRETIYNIGREAGVDDTHVSRSMKELMSLLPDLEIVDKRFKPAVEALLRRAGAAP